MVTLPTISNDEDTTGAIKLPQLDGRDELTLLGAPSIDVRDAAVMKHPKCGRQRSYGIPCICVDAAVACGGRLNLLHLRAFFETQAGTHKTGYSVIYLSMFSIRFPGRRRSSAMSGLRTAT